MPLLRELSPVAHGDSPTLSSADCADLHDFARQHAPASSFFDRDLSQVRFHRRVLEEASDAETPLLERVKFLSIFGTNLDDFVSTRGPVWRADPAKRLVVESLVRGLFRDAYRLWRRDLAPALAAQGIEFVGYGQLDAAERRDVDEHFARLVRPTLAPAACDGTRPGDVVVPSFGLNLAVEALGGILSGAGTAVEGPRGTNGVFIMAIDVARFTPLAAFIGLMGGLGVHVKEPPYQPGVSEVLLPGEPERRTMAQRLRDGVPLDDETWKQTVEAAAVLGVGPLELPSA